MCLGISCLCQHSTSWAPGVQGAEPLGTKPAEYQTTVLNQQTHKGGGVMRLNDPNTSSGANHPDFREALRAGARPGQSVGWKIGQPVRVGQSVSQFVGRPVGVGRSASVGAICRRGRSVGRSVGRAERYVVGCVCCVCVGAGWVHSVRVTLGPVWIRYRKSLTPSRSWVGLLCLCYVRRGWCGSQRFHGPGGFSG